MVFDLRSDGERAAEPDRVPRGVGYAAFDVLRDASGITTADYARLTTDPELARATLGDGRGAVMWQATFRQMVDLPSAREGFGRLYRELADARNRPALIHCSTGVNRTGWAVAALLLLLGSSDEVVLQDYLLSGPRLESTIRPILAAFSAQGGDPELLMPMIGVRRENLGAALERMRSVYGTVERYFQDGLGVDDSTRRALRIGLVESGAPIQC